MNTFRYPGAWPAVVDFIAATGTHTIFGLPGDDLNLVSALRGGPVRLLLCRDQRNAAFMATGFATQSGGPGVCVVGKGPATTNALTGILEARCGAVPLMVLAAGTAVAQRGHRAFQELDQLAFIRPMVKWAERIDHPDRLVPALETAWATAAHGAAGPVYLELPDHLTTTPIDRHRPWQIGLEQSVEYRCDPASNALALIRSSRRCAILVGGGARHRNHGGVLQCFAEHIGAPLFATASGRGAVDEDHELFLGLAGLYLRPDAARIWRELDLVISLGSRLEETARFGWEAAPPPVVQVNIAAEEFSADHEGPRVLGDLLAVVRAWLTELPQRERDTAWFSQIAEARTRMFDEAKRLLAVDPPRDGRIRVAAVLATMDATLPVNRITVQENGLQDMWSYLFPFHQVRSGAGVVAPSEQTPLGFGAAASGGVAVAAPDRLVVAFVGDGAFELFGGDLATFARERLGVLFVVLCNGGYGWLQSQLNHNHPGSYPGLFADDSRPPLATSGIEGVRDRVVTDLAALRAELRTAARHCQSGGIAIVRVPVALSDEPPGIAESAADSNSLKVPM